MTFAQEVVRNIPGPLRQGSRHNIWRYEERRGKRSKRPYTPAGIPASHSDPRTWSTFGSSLSAVNKGRGDGLGYMLGGGICGIDLDGCIDADTGEITDFASSLVHQCASYTELSPSGTGLHICVAATEGDGLKLPHIEVYRCRRSLTLTGEHYGGTPREIVPFNVTALIHDLRPPTDFVSALAPQEATRLEDAELLARAFRSKNGDSIARLWEGDTEPYPSASEADAALAARLAFWTGPDVERLCLLMRLSALRRSKWDIVNGLTGMTYLEATAAFAIERTANFYKGRLPRSYQ